RRRVLRLAVRTDNPNRNAHAHLAAAHPHAVKVPGQAAIIVRVAGSQAAAFRPAELDANFLLTALVAAHRAEHHRIARELTGNLGGQVIARIDLDAVDGGDDMTGRRESSTLS